MTDKKPERHPYDNDPHAQHPYKVLMKFCNDDGETWEREFPMLKLFEFEELWGSFEGYLIGIRMESLLWNKDGSRWLLQKTKTEE